VNCKTNSRKAEGKCLRVIVIVVAPMNTRISCWFVRASMSADGRLNPLSAAVACQLPCYENSDRESAEDRWRARSV
jgi:hypothetical protein